VPGYWPAVPASGRDGPPRPQADPDHPSSAWAGSPTPTTTRSPRSKRSATVARSRRKASWAERSRSHARNGLDAKASLEDAVRRTPIRSLPDRRQEDSRGPLSAASWTGRPLARLGYQQYTVAESVLTTTIPGGESGLSSGLEGCG
jgi:hypothetical protein